MDKSKAIEAALVEGLLASSTGRSVDAETVEQSLLASGWAIVPVEATEEMLQAASAATSMHLDIPGSQLMVNKEKMRIRWRAMIAASQSKERTGG